MLTIDDPSVRGWRRLTANKAISDDRVRAAIGLGNAYADKHATAYVDTDARTAVAFLVVRFMFEADAADKRLIMDSIDLLLELTHAQT